MPDADLSERLFRACVAGCTCRTKTPEVRWHDELCHYRLFTEAHDEIKALRAENADLRTSVIAFGAPAMVSHAQERGLPPRHLHPIHYDILARAGARMDGFARGDVPGDDGLPVLRAVRHTRSSENNTGTASDEDSPAVHILKTWPEFFQHVQDGQKTFEIRKDDRGFRVGDTLWLREWSPTSEEFTGRDIRKKISYILSDGNFGLREGFVCMSICDV